MLIFLFSLIFESDLSQITKLGNLDISIAGHSVQGLLVCLMAHGHRVIAGHKQKAHFLLNSILSNAHLILPVQFLTFSSSSLDYHQCTPSSPLMRL